MMKSLALTGLLVLLWFTPVVGQELARSSTGPVEWTMYRDKAAKVAFMMPKLPVRIDSNDVCSEHLSSSFYAYAGQAVYQFTFHRKGDKAPKSCSQRGKFEQATLDARMAELRQSGPTPPSEKSIEIAGHRATQFTSSNASTHVRVVIPDMENDRWLELAINYRSGASPDEKRFMGSVSFSAQEGADINGGSGSTIGDVEVADLPATAADSSNKVITGLVIVGKPKPAYTDVARRSQTQGTVVLLVTFLRNGSVGAISVLRSVPNGLTEQALSAVRGISFLPALVNGVTVSVTKTVEFSFSIS